MTEQQKKALKDLKELLSAATDCGALDCLQGFLKSPDSINDICDALNEAA